MQAAPLPEDEAERLESLRRTGLLDTDPEPQFDEIVELASHLCGTPVALVSLVDEKRQWFKARFGLHATETPRDVAFCAHAILDPDQTFVVPDTSRDPRFHDNPLVSGPSSVHSYAGRPLRAPDGSPLGTLCVIDHRPRELSKEQLRGLEILAKRVEAELALRASRDVALASMRAKARFLETMSHEIRTPLNGLLGTLELVLDEGLTPGQRRDLEAALGSGRLLQSLLDSVLDLSKADHGRLELHPATVELQPLIDRTLAAFAATARAKRVHVGASIDHDVPGAVEVDGPRLCQILANLVGNAVKFTREGSVELRIERRGEALRFEVRDTGIGIAPKDLDRVLERFEQAADSVGGTGIGLSLARDLVRLMGGELRLESELGVGTAASFELVLEPADVRAAADVDGHDQFTGRVLLVDDEPLNLIIGRRTLERLGLAVATADCGGAALELLRAQSFDAVLLDYQMGDLDGCQVAQQARETIPSAARLPILGLTASATEEVRSRCRAAGIDAVLEKPIDRATLAAALERYAGIQRRSVRAG